ncbi:MAG: hypothetical protein ACREJC_10525, partial [Tepidisphaeraceae bacterium]
AGDSVRAIQLLSNDAEASGCGDQLRGRASGDRFVLFLRPAERCTLSAPAGALPESLLRECSVFVHLRSTSDIDAQTDAETRRMIKDVRSAEAAPTAEQLAAQLDALTLAADDTEAEQAERALLGAGPRVLPLASERMTAANDAARTRLRRVVDQLTPPALAPEGDE